MIVPEKLAQLQKLAQYGGLQLTDITPAMLVEIGGALGLSVSPGVSETVVSLLAGEEPNVKVSDWIKVPGNVQRLREMIHPTVAESTDIVAVMCPLCRGIFQLTPG